MTRTIPLAPLGLALFGCALCLQAPASSATAAAGNGIALTVKGSHILRFNRPIGRIEVDRDDVIGVKAPNPRALAITATGVGDAVLTVYASDGSLLAQTPISVVSRAATSAKAFRADRRFDRVDARSDGKGATILGGSVDSLQARADADRVVAATGEERGANTLAVSGEQMVAVDVQFAAVSSSTLKALGFNFSKLSGDIQGAVISPSNLTSFSLPPGDLSVTASAPLQTAFNLFLAGPNRGIGAVLSALSSNGLSQLLAQPTLMVRSGEQASFLAGGEVPIPVPQGGASNFISIEYKEFGVRLKVTPYVLSKDNIILKIAPEVSELDYANGVRLQGYTVPGLRRRSTETTVQLGSGQSFVLAGLSYTNSNITKEKVPFIGDLPVIGAFFKRQQNQQERQELIIVATPRLVGPMYPGKIPPLPGAATAALNPSIGQMLLGTDGLEQASRPFGVVRR
jgi:pilus assembly protein CpaC